MKWIRKNKASFQWLEAPRLARYPWLRHGFTTRAPGDFNLNYSVAADAATVVRNRRALLRALNTRRRPSWQLVTLRQRHTDLIQVINRRTTGIAGPPTVPDSGVSGHVMLSRPFGSSVKSSPTSRTVTPKPVSSYRGTLT